MDGNSRDINTRHLQEMMADCASQEAINHLFHVTFKELRAMAGAIMQGERAGHTLQPTALINEAYLRLFDANLLDIQSRRHFVNMAAKVMRRILVEHARGRSAAKRGGGAVPVTLGDIAVNELPGQSSIEDLDAALEKFSSLDERGAKVAELRIFTGLPMSQIAETLGVSRRTTQTDWRVASMWLRRELSLAPPPALPPSGVEGPANPE